MQKQQGNQTNYIKPCELQISS